MKREERRDRNVRDYIESLGLGPLRVLCIDMYNFIESHDNMGDYADWCYCNLKEGQSTPESRLCDAFRKELTAPSERG